MVMVFSQGYMYLRKQRNKTIALFLLQDALENASWTTSSYGESYSTISQYPDFRRVVVVSNVAAHLKRVNVTVYWNNDNSSKAMFKMVTDY